jgi:hypothetical protein
MQRPAVTITRTLAWISVAMVMAGCQAPWARPTSTAATPQSITLQASDIPGMQRCAASGDVTAVLNSERAQRSPGYDMNATEWAQWKRQGAVDAYLAVYGKSAADCAAASDSSIGAPTGGLMVGLVVQFKDTNRAATNFQRESTLLGLGPKNIRFIELSGGTTTFGQSTGLGIDSVVGSAVVAGADYYVAMWQSRRFELDFIGYDMAFADANNAVTAMNRRLLQS